jgi:hypothetical protein
LVTIAGTDGEPRLIVCAVPYLRDRDIRTAEAGESVEDKERKIIEGIGIITGGVRRARRKNFRLKSPVPIVVMDICTPPAEKPSTATACANFTSAPFCMSERMCFPRISTTSPWASSYPADRKRSGADPLFRFAPPDRFGKERRKKA